MSDQKTVSNNADESTNAGSVRLNDLLGVLRLYHKAAERQKKALESEYKGWGHAVWCNYSIPFEGQTFCNCGIADLQYALKEENRIMQNA